ncbi:MAG TPA: class I SAM-dependent methyltransferase [Promineifilum sp.]|nr:class I SAM-dependent methyltransferase [Promineifilum sp.]
MDYSFPRYLAAKQSIDDRSLNHTVWRMLLHELPPGPLDILEVGAGTGTMIDRLAARGMLSRGGRYTAIDADPAGIAEARMRLAAAELPVHLELMAIDVHDFVRRERKRRWDLLIAHAFLDLVNVPRLLPQLFALLRPGGLFYFTINFDGLTVLEPTVDPEFEQQVIDLYHRTMDERRVGGRPTGGSRAGRALLGQIPDAGGEILAAGSSDWIVMPHKEVYPDDEAYFLRHILYFFEGSLAGRSELDPARFAAWLARRRAQIDGGELVFIAHQLDLCGRVGE